MKFLLLHAPQFDPAPYAAAFAEEQVEVRSISMPGQLKIGEVPTALVLDALSRDRFPVKALQGFVNAGGAVLVLGEAGETDLPERFPTNLVTAFLSDGYGARQFLVALRSSYRESAARSEAVRARSEAASRTKELTELTR
ncbi:MAG: hypothetical protein VKI81_12450, partial [Synechococcaceae cyanobacterium]|nr:hypothetical protein [Synechococcaceae cyanobacterium]